MMVRKSYGTRRGTRKKLKKKKRVSVNQAIQGFETGQKVHIELSPAAKSIIHPRFQGKTGTITGKRGRSYIVEVSDIKAKKTVITGPEHLKPQR